MNDILFVIFIITRLFDYQQKENTGLPHHSINNRVSKDIRKFIPQNKLILDQANGDINQDGLVDKILVLREKKEITTEEKRSVIILIRQKDNFYEKVAKNDNIVFSLADGGIHGDPYYGIAIKNNCFSIEHFGGSSWRWNQVITFKYDKIRRNWYWLNTGSESWHMTRTSNFRSFYETQNDKAKILFTAFKNNRRDK